MDRTFQHQVYDKTQRDMEVNLATESCKCDNPNQNRIFGNAGGQSRRSAKMGEESVRDTAGGVLADVEWTRRGFIGRLGGMMAAAGVRVPFAGPAMAAAAVDRTADCRPRYRAVSWWLSFDDLAWPNGELMDAVRRRATGARPAVLTVASFRRPLSLGLPVVAGTICFAPSPGTHQRNIVRPPFVRATHGRALLRARNIWRRNRIVRSPFRGGSGDVELNGPAQRLADDR
jgi:hypothetical protein